MSDIAGSAIVSDASEETMRRNNLFGETMSTSPIAATPRQRLATVGALLAGLLVVYYQPAFWVAAVGLLARRWLRAEPFPLAGVFVPVAQALLAGGLLGPALFAIAQWILSAEPARALNTLRDLDVALSTSQNYLKSVDGNLYGWLAALGTALVVTIATGTRGLVAKIKRLKELLTILVLALSTASSFTVEWHGAAAAKSDSIELAREIARESEEQLAARLLELRRQIRLAVSLVAEKSSLFAAVSALAQELESKPPALKSFAEAVAQLQSQIDDDEPTSFADLPESVRVVTSQNTYIWLETADRHHRIEQRRLYVAGHAHESASHVRPISTARVSNEVHELSVVQPLPENPTEATLKTAADQLERGRATLARLNVEAARLDASVAEKSEAIHAALREAVPALDATGLKAVTNEALRNILGEFAGALSDAALHAAVARDRSPLFAQARQKAAQYAKTLVTRLTVRAENARTGLASLLAANRHRVDLAGIPDPASLASEPAPRSETPDEAAKRLAQAFSEKYPGGKYLHLDLAVLRGLATRSPYHDRLLRAHTAARYPEATTEELKSVQQERWGLEAGAPTAKSAGEIAMWTLLTRPSPPTPWDGGVKAPELRRRMYAAIHFGIRSDREYSRWSNDQQTQIRIEQNRLDQLRRIDKKIADIHARGVAQVHFNETVERAARRGRRAR